MNELHAAIADFLRGQRRLVPPAPPRFCRSCGRPIVTGAGRFPPGVLYDARRCADCYARVHPEQA